MKWFSNPHGQLSRPHKQSARRGASLRPQLETFGCWEIRGIPRHADAFQRLEECPGSQQQLSAAQPRNASRCSIPAGTAAKAGGSVRLRFPVAAAADLIPLRRAESRAFRWASREPPAIPGRACRVAPRARFWARVNGRNGQSSFSCTGSSWCLGQSFRPPKWWKGVEAVASPNLSPA